MTNILEQIKPGETIAYLTQDYNGGKFGDPLVILGNRHNRDGFSMDDQDPNPHVYVQQPDHIGFFTAEIGQELSLDPPSDEDMMAYAQSRVDMLTEKLDSIIEERARWKSMVQHYQAVCS